MCVCVWICVCVSVTAQCEATKNAKFSFSFVSDFSLPSIPILCFFFSFLCALSGSAPFHGIQGALLPPGVRVRLSRSRWSGGAPLLSGKPALGEAAPTLIACQNTHDQTGEWEKEEKRDQEIQKRGQKAAFVLLMVPTLIHLLPKSLFTPKQ